VFQGQCDRLRAHAQNLLELGKPQRPKLERLDLPAFLDRVTGLLVESGVLKQLRIVRSYAEGLPPIIGDDALLEQVVRNLEINAAHAMEGGGTLTLRAWAAEGGREVAFAVADTGHGIPDDLLAQVLEPFFSTKGEGRGTGLGLYISGHIVEAHGGRLDLRSRVGEGTMVTVFLPAHPE
ncbi:MAG: two-component system sensor histidine kinase NtrB, partial [Deferrisomatales bacterium]